MRPVSQFSPVWESRDSRRCQSSASKSKRTPTDADEDETEHDRSSQREVDEYRQSITTLGGRKDQFYVAGLAPDHAPPPPPFPHGFRGHDRRLDLRPEAQVPDNAPSLQQQHLAAMTSVLHTSLLKGDYVRAGRAWGMLLRSSSAGRSIDLRLNGRWGIGAEILLKRDGSKKTQVSSIENDHSEDPSSKIPISRESFQAAKDYYEQLILQYPYQRHLPHSINAMTFYPAMFGLMIYEAVEMSKRAMSEVQESTPEPSSPNLSDASGASQNTIAADVKRTELETATTIAARMDETLLTPPYDKYAALLQLRGMVSLWMADLYEDIHSLYAEPEDGDAASQERSMQIYTAYAARQEHERMLMRAESEREKAQSHFRKSLSGGRQLPPAIKKII
ncbi:hypothetical protein MBLNU457_6387t1 [Dothideomycetes sp. NU457]